MLPGCTAEEASTGHADAAIESGLATSSVAGGAPALAASVGTPSVRSGGLDVGGKVSLGTFSACETDVAAAARRLAGSAV